MTHIWLVLGGRTYPLEGAAVLFPQHAPYNDPLRVLICGGSNLGAGQAIDNCVSMAPEDPNPTWTLERMVGTARDLGEVDLTQSSIALSSRYAMHRESPLAATLIGC